tara:strand:+ start:1288 stop:2910 length:1623 start_codon:yes stop_codon:yes gene_type:complete
MAIPFLNDINLNENELLNAKLHTDSSAPSNPGTGSVWFDTGTNLLKIYRGGSWTNLFVKTEAIANGGTNLGTADQIHTFVTTQSDTIAASTSGTAAIATTVTVADESSDTTCFPLFATAATGNLGPKSGTNLTFNSDTGILTATGFAGNITGNVTGNADTVTTNANLTGDVTSSGNATTIAADAVHATMINDDIISAQTELASGVADADEILISDSGAVKKVGMDTLKTYFTGDDVSIANLTARLPQITESLTIGDATDVTITTSGGLIVTGDLTVSGNTTTVNTATLTVEDPLIKLAKGNTSADSVDIGLFGTYNNGATQLYTGFFRDASDSGKWILYKDSEADPGTGTTVNVSGTGHAVATLKANLEGNVTGTISTASQTNITAIGTIATGVWEATDIAIAHGGTGASTAAAAFTNLKQAATTSATGVVELATTTEASTGTDTSRAITAEGLQQFHNDRNKSFELDNSASGVASTDNITYTITHGMGASRLYKVEVIEDASNYETVYVEVQRPSDTTIKVIFGSAVTAGAYRALVTKI